MRLGECPFVEQDRSLPRDGAADHGLAIVRIRVEIPRQAIDLNRCEFSCQMTLTVVPRDLTVRDDLDARLVLLPQHGLDDLPLERFQRGFVDLAFVEARNPPTKDLL